MHKHLHKYAPNDKQTGGKIWSILLCNRFSVHCPVIHKVLSVGFYSIREKPAYIYLHSRDVHIYHTKAILGPTDVPQKSIFLTKQTMNLCTFWKWFDTCKGCYGRTRFREIWVLEELLTNIATSPTFIWPYGRMCAPPNRAAQESNHGTMAEFLKVVCFVPTRHYLQCIICQGAKNPRSWTILEK